MSEERKDTTLPLSKTTKELLEKKAKLHFRETYEDIILRLLKCPLSEECTTFDSKEICKIGKFPLCKIFRDRAQLKRRGP